MVTVSQMWSKVSQRAGEWSAVQFLKDTWLFLLLLLLGVCAFITAVIIAYPALAHLAAKLFQ